MPPWEQRPGTAGLTLSVANSSAPSQHSQGIFHNSTILLTLLPSQRAHRMATVDPEQELVKEGGA